MRAGIICLLFARGLGDEADTLGAIFWWEGPDGTRLLAHRLLGSYDNARSLGRSDGDAVREFAERHARNPGALRNKRPASL